MSLCAFVVHKTLLLTLHRFLDNGILLLENNLSSMRDCFLVFIILTNILQGKAETPRSKSARNGAN